jgi:hypothetical protein
MSKHVARKRLAQSTGAKVKVMLKLFYQTDLCCKLNVGVISGAAGVSAAFFFLVSLDSWVIPVLGFAGYFVFQHCISFLLLL